jgi:hypothetical protein
MRSRVKHREYGTLNWQVSVAVFRMNISSDATVLYSYFSEGSVCVSGDVIVNEARQMKYSSCTESGFMVNETSNRMTASTLHYGEANQIPSWEIIRDL